MHPMTLTSDRRGSGGAAGGADLVPADFQLGTASGVEPALAFPVGQLLAETGQPGILLALRHHRPAEDLFEVEGHVAVERAARVGGFEGGVEAVDGLP